MRNYFDWLLADTWKSTLPIFNWEEEVRESEYKKKVLGTETKQVTVNSNGWISERKNANMRFARFQSKIIDIATIMIYPTASPDHLPVFAAEWVAVQNNIHVIVLDVEFLEDIRSPQTKELDLLKRKWEIIFSPKKEKPNWFSEIESPWSIFSSSTIEELPALREMFNDYLNCTLKDIYIPNFESSLSGFDHPRVREYKKHHAKNSPAHKVVSVIDQNWLINFLYENHFKIIQ